MQSVIMLSVIYAERHYAECKYAMCHYAECHCAECHTECRYAQCRCAECRCGECRCAECFLLQMVSNVPKNSLKIKTVLTHLSFFRNSWRQNFRQMTLSIPLSFIIYKLCHFNFVMKHILFFKKVFELRKNLETSRGLCNKNL